MLAGLKHKGYMKTSPVCEIKIMDQSKNICRYGVFLVDGFQKVPFRTYSIEATESVDADAIIEGIEVELSEGEMSAYNIKNTESFLERISSWVYEKVQNTDMTP